MNGVFTKSIGFGAASLLAGFVFAGPALADGLPNRGKVKTTEVSERPCTASGNVAFTTDFVFRGISQSNENAAVQGGVDLTCGNFYVGVWGSSFDGSGHHHHDDGGSLWLNTYGGFRTSTGPVTWDVGFIHYAFPGSFDGDRDFVELKLAASGEVWKGGKLGGVVYYAPDYFGKYDSAWTVEGSFAQVLPNVGFFTPIFSATVGHTFFSEEYHYHDLDYTYWNVGVTLGFHEKWSIDLRYWDTDNEGLAYLKDSRADERFVATLKYRF
jgi:uncharacterized protein (TIGR02001 family)